MPAWTTALLVTADATGRCKRRAYREATSQYVYDGLARRSKRTYILDDEIRTTARTAYVTAHTTRCGVTPPELLNTPCLNFDVPPLHSGNSRNC